MLLLTRRPSESIVILEGKIEIQVVYVHRGHVCLAIKAPKDIAIDRKEIFLRKQAELLEAEKTIIPESN